MPTEKEELLDLRNQIDKVDDSIQDLLNERAEIVEKVRIVKDRHNSNVKIRPAREANIIYRLIKRHNGRFPKRELARIWRELIVATISFEGPFTLAVFYTDTELGYWDLARDQYGCYTPAKRYSSPRRVVEAVQSGEATIGIVPVPRHDDDEIWWRLIVSERPGTPKIIARLPFIGSGNSRNKGLEAIVVCAVEHEETERARSFIAIEASEDIGFNVINNCLMQANVLPVFQQVWHDPESPPRWIYLVELSGFLSQKGGEDSLLVDALGKKSLKLLHLGGYAMPLSEKDFEIIPK